MEARVHKIKGAPVIWNWIDMIVMSMGIGIESLTSSHKTCLMSHLNAANAKNVKSKTINSNNNLFPLPIIRAWQFFLKEILHIIAKKQVIVSAMTDTF